MVSIASLVTSPPPPPISATSKALSARSSSSFSPLPLTNSVSTPHISLRPNIKHLRFTPLQCLPPSQPHPQPLSKTLTLPKFPLPFFTLPQITPISVCKWSLIASLALFLTKKTISILLNPFFWTYFSFTWIFYPYLLSLALALFGLYSLYRHSSGSSSIIHQLAIVTSTITFLTLVPPAHFNGFLQGWPIALFFIYHYFFFFESSVRHRLYGDLQPRPHDPKWDVNLSTPFKLAFFALVLAGHFLAAYEGPELHLISGGWTDFVTWGLVLITLFMRYHSVLYLAKYSEKVAVPTAVVQFGPYRFVRHPIYGSVILLFALHCITLRAPISLGFLVAVCVWYYGRKAEVEETLLLEEFGERYREYMGKVRYRLIPLLY